jgi:hypothetical protein
VNRNLRAGFALIAAVMLAHRVACADPDSSSAGPTTQPAEPASSPAASAPADKSRYTLFNPTPTDQLRSMDTDRPNVTNTPHTIDAGHLQIETGVIDYTYFRDDSAGDNVREDDFDFGQFNFRLGVLNNLEVNAVVDAFDLDEFHDYSASASSRATSFGDTVVGAKLNLWGDDGADGVWASGLAIQPQFKFPTAAADVGNGHFEFYVALPFLMNLPADFHLGVQPGVADERNLDNTGYVTGFPISISLDRVLLANIDFYVEFACDPTTQRHVSTEQTIDIGGTYPLGDNVVLDAGVNLGLNKVSTTVEALAGISIRL